MSYLNESNYCQYQDHFDTSHPEYQRYLTDFQDHPLWEKYESIYRGINYEIKRVRISHLCGYVMHEEDDLFTDEEIDEI